VQEDEKPFNIRHKRYYFSREVISFVKNCKYERIYNSLFDQLIRSATSIGPNLVEGKSGSSRKDWRNFLVIALKSANETKYLLCLIKDTMDVDAIAMTRLLKEAEEISNIIAKILINAEKNE